MKSGMIFVINHFIVFSKEMWLQENLIANILTSPIFA